MRVDSNKLPRAMHYDGKTCYLLHFAMQVIGDFSSFRSSYGQVLAAQHFHFFHERYFVTGQISISCTPEDVVNPGIKSLMLQVYASFISKLCTVYPTLCACHTAVYIA